MLAELGIRAIGYVTAMRDIAIDIDVAPDTIDAVIADRDASSMYCPDEQATTAMETFVRAAKKNKDTVGGLCFNTLERAPRKGERIHVPGYRLECIDVSGSRITRVHIAEDPNATSDNN